MPRRRNNRYRATPSSYEEPTNTGPRTTDEMARDLVHRGLASVLILDRPYTPQRDT